MSSLPAAAFSYSLPDMPRFHFYHYNDQQEIVICMAAEGGSLVTGQLYVQQSTHGVTMFLKKPAAPAMEAFQVCIIVIRMKDAGEQNEAKMFRCRSCNEVVFRYDRDVATGQAHKYYPELPNVRLYADAVDAFNASDRICPACGLQQDPFPQDIAGLAPVRPVRRSGEPSPRGDRRRGGAGSSRRWPHDGAAPRAAQDPQRPEGGRLAHGSYDDFPVAPAGVDPAPHLSRNTRCTALLAGDPGRTSYS